LALSHSFVVVFGGAVALTIVIEKVSRLKRDWIVMTYSGRISIELKTRPKLRCYWLLGWLKMKKWMIKGHATLKEIHIWHIVGNIHIEWFGVGRCEK
jgi:hypothetical protein